MAVGEPAVNQTQGVTSVITWHISHTLSEGANSELSSHVMLLDTKQILLCSRAWENVGRTEVAAVNHPNQHSFHSHLSLGSYKGGHVLP